MERIPKYSSKHCLCRHVRCPIIFYTEIPLLIRAAVTIAVTPQKLFSPGCSDLYSHSIQDMLFGISHDANAEQSMFTMQLQACHQLRAKKVLMILSTCLWTLCMDNWVNNQPPET